MLVKEIVFIKEPKIIKLRWILLFDQQAYCLQKMRIFPPIYFTKNLRKKYYTEILFQLLSNYMKLAMQDNTSNAF